MSEEETYIIKMSEDEYMAYKILRVGAKFKRQHQEGDLLYGSSPEDLINWGIICHNGYYPKKVTEETLIALNSDNHEIHQQVRGIVEKV